MAEEPQVGFVTMGDAASEGDIPSIGIGMLGYAFMGKAHSNALKKIAYMTWPPPYLPRLVAISGRNEEAVRLSGVNTDRWKIAVYTLSGSICGIAGLLIASRLNSAQPALGLGYELDAIAAVVIGGTSLAGGRGSILGTIIGALIMSVLLNGLRILSVAQEWQTVVTGIIIIAAVYADMLRRRRMG